MVRMDRAKVVLVTQVGQGYGRAVALAYGHAGYDVVCADRDVDLAARTAAEIEELGGQAIPIQADPTAALDVQAAFAKVWEIFGSLSGVVHTTTFESATPFPLLAEGELIELFDETVRSTVLVLRAALRSAPGAWVVVVAPAANADQPHVAAVGGALARLASSFPTPGAPVAAVDDFEAAPARPGLRVNVVVPSRPASDPRHDAPLVHAVRMLGGRAGDGVCGAEIAVALPPPPQVIEALLPEVQAALDDTVRQDEDFETFEEPADADEPRTTPNDPVLDDGLDDEALTAAHDALRRLVPDDDEAPFARRPGGRR